MENPLVIDSVFTMIKTEKKDEGDVSDTTLSNVEDIDPLLVHIKQEKKDEFDMPDANISTMDDSYSDYEFSQDYDEPLQFEDLSDDRLDLNDSNDSLDKPSDLQTLRAILSKDVDPYFQRFMKTPTEKSGQSAEDWHHRSPPDLLCPEGTSPGHPGKRKRSSKRHPPTLVPEVTETGDGTGAWSKTLITKFITIGD